MLIWSRLRRLEAEVLSELDGDILAPHLDGGEAGRIAIAVHRAAGIGIMTGTQWGKMPPEDRVPLLEVTLHALRAATSASDSDCPRVAADERPEAMRAAASTTSAGEATPRSRVVEPLPEPVWNVRVVNDETQPVPIAQATSRAPAPAEVPPPAEPRLTVDERRMTVTFDGQTADVSSLAAFRWVRVLAANPGVWVSSKELESIERQLLKNGEEPILLEQPKTHRFRAYLPDAVAALIDMSRGKGSRIRL